MNREDLSEPGTILALLIAAMVAEPEEVRLESVTVESVTTFTIRAAPRDLGKLIGRGGRIARSLRIVMGAVAARTGHRIALNIPNEEPFDQAIELVHSPRD